MRGLTEDGALAGAAFSNTAIFDSTGPGGQGAALIFRSLCRQVNRMTSHLRPILIAGPTASGKSALALELARGRDALIINADSMQVYRELRILTARPSGEEECQAEHVLYGHVAANDAYSVARWIADVRQVLADAKANGQTPIFVGGTGLYFKALLEGLSPVPEIPADIRSDLRVQAQAKGARQMHARLQACDPEMAERLNPADTQRVTRALEVLEATGRSLLHWQRLPGTPLLQPEATDRRLVLPSRAVLHDRCDRRFAQMMAMGALGEVEVLAQLGLPTTLPIMQALGVRPLLRHLAGDLSREAAIAAGMLETRQYVKRQETWARRYMITWMTT